MTEIRELIKDFEGKFSIEKQSEEKIVCKSLYNPKEKTASMHIDLINNRFYCFSASKGGYYRDLLNLLIEDNRDRERYLAAKGFNITTYNSFAIYNDFEIQAIFIFDFITEIANYNLMNHEQDALSYLVTERKLTRKSIEDFKLGIIKDQDDIIDILRKKSGSSIDSVVLESLDLLFDGKFKFANRILIPLLDRFSNIVGFESRSIDGSGDRYLKLSNHDSERYSTILSERIFFRGPESEKYTSQMAEIIFVEGPFDLIRLAEVGISNVFSLLTKTITNKQRQYLRSVKFSKYRIIFMLDMEVSLLRDQHDLVKSLFDEGFLNLLEFKYTEEYDDPDDYFSSVVIDNTRKHILENSKPISGEYIESRLSLFLNDTTIDPSTFIKEISNLVKYNPTQVQAINDKVNLYRQVDSETIKNYFETALNKDSVLKTYLAKKLNLHYNYVEYLLNESDKITEITPQIVLLEVEIYDYLIDNIVNTHLNTNNMFAAKHIVRSIFSNKADTFKEMGLNTIKVENDVATYLVITFDYLEAEVTVEKRYRKYSTEHPHLDDHKALFELDGFKTNSGSINGTSKKIIKAIDNFIRDIFKIESDKESTDEN